METSWIGWDGKRRPPEKIIFGEPIHYAYTYGHKFPRMSTKILFLMTNDNKKAKYDNI
jgi:hypothetical protein